jgi:hypothetical protein
MAPAMHPEYQLTALEFAPDDGPPPISRRRGFDLQPEALKTVRCFFNLCQSVALQMLQAQVM